MEISLSSFAPENSVSRATCSAVPSRVSLLILHVIQADSGAYLTCFFASPCLPRRRPPIPSNGRSLNWMGLTRERWCCTRGWMSRLDMNTCRTSIKTDILFSAALTHIPGLSDRHEITVSSPTELNYEGNLIRQNKGSPKNV